MSEVLGLTIARKWILHQNSSFQVWYGLRILPPNAIEINSLFWFHIYYQSNHEYLTTINHIDSNIPFHCVCWSVEVSPAALTISKCENSDNFRYSLFWISTRHTNHTQAYCANFLHLYMQVLFSVNAIFYAFYNYEADLFQAVSWMFSIKCHLYGVSVPARSWCLILITNKQTATLSCSGVEVERPKQKENSKGHWQWWFKSVHMWN